MSENSKTPWAIGKKVPSAVYADDETPVCICDSMEEASHAEEATNARRIVACVNACEGLATGFMEGLLADGKTLDGEMRDRIDTVSSLLIDKQTLQRQRDQLLDALRGYEGVLKACRGIPTKTTEVEALAEARQKASDAVFKVMSTIVGVQPICGER